MSILKPSPIASQNIEDGILAAKKIKELHRIVKASILFLIGLYFWYAEEIQEQSELLWLVMLGGVAYLVIYIVLNEALTELSKRLRRSDYLTNSQDIMRASIIGGFRVLHPTLYAQLPTTHREYFAQ
jgi:hypothetical protein